MHSSKGDEVISGDADISAIGALLADPARATVLLALADGRALPASTLAAEAGLSPQATSAHLKKLLAGDLVAVRTSGRHRYYRLAHPDVAAILENIARIAPRRPIRSLRQDTRARAMRAGRMCYDHLAGVLGVSIMDGLLDRGALNRTDGVRTARARETDPLAASLPDHPYQLGPHAPEVFEQLGVDVAELEHARSRRPLLRCCVDWTEQQHHLAGRLGAAVADACVNRGWITRKNGQRAVRLTESGGSALLDALGIDSG